MYALSLPQIDASARGIHLLWAGPTPWFYSPGGWDIQRRRARERPLGLCDGLNVDAVHRLRQEREARLRFGWLTLADGQWPDPIDPGAPPHSSLSCEVFTLVLDRPAPEVRVSVRARESFVLGLREAKVVATGGDPRIGEASFHLGAPLLDSVVVYAREAYGLDVCIDADPETDRDWDDAPYLVRGLQIPLQEVMPGLAGPAAELAEARRRLMPGETIDTDDFAQRVAAAIRPALAAVKPPRPIDQVLLLRHDPTAGFEELVALDPIRLLIWHPTWRRALGFGFFDDHDLEVGRQYQYRVTGHFPVEDLLDRVYGFHTVPSRTALPAEFYLRDLRLRFAHPVTVGLAPGTPTGGLAQVSRRGVPLPLIRHSHWLLPDLEDWGLVIDFPSPVEELILELAPGHDLRFQAVLSTAVGAVVLEDRVPPGPRPRLSLPSPVEQLRLRGPGFLYAIRLPAGPKGVEPRSVVLPPVTFLDTPRPVRPVSASVANLQQPSAPTPTADVPTGAPPLRHQLGFEIRWRPSLVGGLKVWPKGQTASAPLEASIFQVEHRQLPATEWRPVLDGENFMLGNREQAPPERQVYPGADVMRLYPETRAPTAGAGLDFTWRDVFDRENSDEIVRPVPPLGTEHQYRVRTVDAVGRPSLDWRETNVQRLEKHLPPPLPVGPEQVPASERALPVPTGVQARVLVREAPDLTPADLALLGPDDNAIVLRWGWHAQQRSLDPYAREFRIYFAAHPLDVIEGVLTGVTTLSPGVYRVTLQLARPVVKDAAAGSYLRAGYPFYIRTHGAGAAITADVETKVPQGGGAGGLAIPKLGAIQLPLRLTPSLTRPPAWTERVEVQSITAQTEYQAVLRNRMTLTPSHGRDAVWVGVSAADDQAYVADQLAPLQTRPGNESAIVALRCEARYQGRPVFDVPPRLQPVPVLVAPEPAGRTVIFPLNLAADPAYLAGSGLAPGVSVQVERASADAVFGAYFVAPGDRIMARVLEPRQGGDADLELPRIAAANQGENPADRAAVIAALRGGRPSELEDHFVVFLAGVHPYRDRLFAGASAGPIPLGPFPESLPPEGGRYVYRFRRADAAGNLSRGAAVANVIVRVPNLTPSAAPERTSGEPDGAEGTLRLRIVPDPEVTHVLTFCQPAASGGSGPVAEAELLRVANRPDLYPAAGNAHQGKAAFRLRAPDGALLNPEHVKSLSDADVSRDPERFRSVRLGFTAGPGQRVRVWACTLTRDGIPSLLGGPWSLAFSLAPPPAPALAVQPGPVFTWSWPAPPDGTSTVELQRSDDGNRWLRSSPPLTASPGPGSYPAGGAYDAPPGQWRYRLLVRTLDGREAASNEVTP